MKNGRYRDVDQTFWFKTINCIVKMDPLWKATMGHVFGI